MALSSPPTTQQLHYWYESVNKSQIESDFLIVDPHSAEGSLGPFYRSSMVDSSLNQSSPVMAEEILPINQPHLDLNRWTSFIKHRTWPSNLPIWREWVDRIVTHRINDLLSSGIHNAILLSKHPIVMNHQALAAVMNFWSVSTNSFHFQFGMMTPTLLDIHALLGLSPLGETIDANMKISPTSTFTCQFSSYKELIDNYKKSEGNVEDEEYIAFLLLWICRYLTCTPSYCIKQSEVRLAIALSEGRFMSLGIYVLSFLYRSCFNLVNSGFNSFGGPFWILQLWLHAYFPSQMPSRQINLPDFTAFGNHYIQFDSKDMSLTNIFGFFHKTKSYHRTLPFERVHGKPRWLFPCDNKDELWSHYLISRDLPHGLVIEHTGSNRCGVEIYNPHFVANQFGLKQYVPVPFQFSANNSSSVRIFFNKPELVERVRAVFQYLSNRFTFAPFNSSTEVTLQFQDFWQKHVHDNWLMTEPLAISLLSQQFDQGIVPRRVKTTVPNPLLKIKTPKKRKTPATPVRRSNRQVRRTKTTGPSETIEVASSTDMSNTQTETPSEKSETETFGGGTASEQEVSPLGGQKFESQGLHDDGFVGTFKVNSEMRAKLFSDPVEQTSSSSEKKSVSPECKKSLTRMFGGSTSSHPTPSRSNRYTKLFDGLLLSPLIKTSVSPSDSSTKSKFDKMEVNQFSAEEIEEAQNVILGVLDESVGGVARMKAEILRALDILGNQKKPIFPIETLRDGFLQIFPAHEALLELGVADQGLQSIDQIKIKLLEKEMQTKECETDVAEGIQATETLRDQVKVLEGQLQMVKNRLMTAEQMKTEDEHRLIICQDDVSKLKRDQTEAEKQVAALQAKKELATHTILQAKEKMKQIEEIIKTEFQP